MQSFLNYNKAGGDDKREQDSLFIKPAWQNIFHKPNVTQKQINKFIAFEKQHPFLQSDLLLEDEIKQKSFKIDRSIKKKRKQSILNSYKDMNNEKFMRQCCINRQRKQNDCDVDHQWNYKESFKQIE